MKSVTTIEESAFSSTQMNFVKIPHSVTTLETNCFGRNDSMIIIGCAGSPAQAYAQENNIIFATIPCKNHLFVRGECSCCHVLLGDLNGDGQRTTADLDLLTSYVNKTAACPDMETADMNGDGALDTNDENLLMRLLLGYDIWS